jgi:peptidoglycan hydrolase-like protein with peptidoglycan-binding domain
VARRMSSRWSLCTQSASAVRMVFKSVLIVAAAAAAVWMAVPSGLAVAETIVPSVCGLAPSQGLAEGGTSVSITGSGFVDVCAVTFGGVDATDFLVVSDTEITAVAPASEAGVVDVVVTTAAGTSSNDTADDFTYLEAAVPPSAAEGLSTETTLGPQGDIEADSALTVSSVAFRYEQNDSRIAYAGSWTTYSNATMSGDSIDYSNAGGASVTIQFAGTSLSWICLKSSMYGIAKVTVDDTTVDYVDLYSPTPVCDTSVWDTGTLPDGNHKVLIEWTGTKNAASTGTYVGLDAVDVVGTIVQASPPLSVHRYEQNDSRIAYAGSWTTYSNATMSGASIDYSNAGGASVTIQFTGTSLSWICLKSSMYGIAKVTVDDTTVDYVDLYSPTPVCDTSVWDTGTLPDGNHKVLIEWTGTKNAASTGTYVGLDAVDVVGTIVQASPPLSVHRYEQNDSRIAYAGSWTTYSNSALSGGSVKYSKNSGASVTIQFTGTSLGWVCLKGPMYGIAKVTLDGNSVDYVDLYSASSVPKADVWSTGLLPYGTHKVLIEWTGTKNAASADTYIGADAFDVVGTIVQATPPPALFRYEQNDSRIAYAGSWTTYSNSALSGGSVKYSKDSGASVTMQFTGTSLSWICLKGPMYGIAKVTLDGTRVDYVDLYSATSVPKADVWSTGQLASGSHRVTIQWTGMKNDASSDTYIGVDAFDVAGTLPWSANLTAAEIKWVEQRLADLSYRPGAIDGVFDVKTRGAVIAFQKWEGLTRDGKITAAVWSRLQTASRPQPSRTGGSNPWIEVNKSKQVLLYCQDGEVFWTIPVSTGNPSVGIETPAGTHKVLRKTTEYSPRYLPLYISNGYLAIHGYPNVPTYPASHGCIRTQKWDQDSLWPLIAVGTYVYIYY